MNSQYITSLSLLYNITAKILTINSNKDRVALCSASASLYGLRSSRTEHYPLNLNVPRVGQIKPPKQVAKSTDPKFLLMHLSFTVSFAKLQEV
jgi:hypothetical protein